MRAAAGVFLLGFSAACSSEQGGPTYSHDVAPLLAAHCTTCHQAGGIAPFSLTDYASAHSRANEIAHATQQRKMPPMPVNNDGSCNTYANARWLSPSEIETFQAWASTGAAEGAPTAASEPPPPPPTLEAPDRTIDIGAEYTPDLTLGGDDYRCFVTAAPVAERAFVTAYEVMPGEPRVVHHVIVYQPANEDAVAEARALDAADTEPGYTCFGSSKVDSTPLALWAPGTGAVTLPEGTGVALAGRRELIVQIHYNLQNGVYPDRTQVALRFAQEPVIRADYWSAANTDMVLPPGLAHVESTAKNLFEKPTSFTVHGALPHMHTLGQTLRVDAQSGTEARCLVAVDRWDFHWQNAWWYDTPLELSDVSSLDIRCGFDTRSRKESVRWGDSTTDEMCISYFYVTTSTEPEPLVSCSDATNPLFGSCFEDLLAGCYEPDLGGSCSASGATLAWSDGSKVVTDGDAPGLYGAGDQAPCASIAAGADGVQLTRAGETVTYAPADGNVVFGCPDGSSVTASGFQLHEFAVCRGLACPD